MTLHLGKRPASPSSSDFRLSAVLDVELVAAKPYKPHDTGFPILMYGNGPDSTAPATARDGAGDCVFAMISNCIQLWRHAAGLPLARLNGTTAIHAYSEVTGYIPGDAETDNGTDMGVAASWWRKTGMRDLDGHRHKIGAFATFDPRNLIELEAVIRTFGVAGIGINFPDYAMDEFNSHRSWAYRAGGRNEGGHAITIPKRRKVYSWAREFGIGDTFIQHQADEGFAFVSPEFLDGSKETPEGLDAAALNRALAALH